MVGTECKLSSFNLTAIRVAGCRVLVLDKPISNLGVSFDRNLSMCNQVHRVVRSAYFQLRSIGLAQKMLTVAATKQLVQALVISRLDYCNSLLTGIPTSLMSRLEMVQHRAARLIFRSSGHQSVTVLMKDLHWLPVTSRVLFKVQSVAYVQPVMGFLLSPDQGSRLSVIEPSQLQVHMSGTVSLVRLETVRLLVRSRES